MTVAAAVTRLQVHSLACTDVKYAPDQPPDNISVFPFAVCYPERGTILSDSGSRMRGLHTIIVEFHVNRTLLATAIKSATGYIEEFMLKLVGDPTLNGAVSTILFDPNSNGVTYEFGRLEWASTPTIGVRFHVPVKILRTP